MIFCYASSRNARVLAQAININLLLLYYYYLFSITFNTATLKCKYSIYTAHVVQCTNLCLGLKNSNADNKNIIYCNTTLIYAQFTDNVIEGTLTHTAIYVMLTYSTKKYGKLYKHHRTMRMKIQ